jgi:hypothetical protein
MLSRIVQAFAFALVAIFLAVTAPSARAAFQFEQLYSNLDGTVQFIVLHDAASANGLQGLHGLTLLSAPGGGPLKTYHFTNDLPSNQTADRRVLIGTRGFAALSLVVPDYFIPDQFIPIVNGNLFFSDATGQLAAASAQFSYQSLVTDGLNALFEIPANTVFVSQNMPTNFAGASASVPVSPVTVVEYYAPSLDHYFITALQSEIDALDTGTIPGWRRTGFGFKVLPSQAAAGPAASPVCRFLIPPQHGNSHFFSASPAECALLLQKAMTDPLYSGYVEETTTAFFIALPDTNTGSCPAGTIPVYRLWNQRADSNHRYTTDALIKAQMIASGSVAEGYGPDAVDMCAADVSTTSVMARVSAASPFAPGCDGVPASGTLYVNSEVEPMVAINPRDPTNIVGVWQQDRWSDGGTPGNLAGASFNGGQTWTLGGAAFSRCAGGTPANGGDYPRVSDPWISSAPDGTMHQSAIAFSGQTQAMGSSSAVVASRSIDGGRTWSKPATLILDVNTFFNDKDSITADPTDASLVYAVWDRLTPDDSGPAMFARSTDGGVTWEPARPLFDPGVHTQTLNNQVVVLSDGTLVDFFTVLDFTVPRTTTISLQLIRSTDKGLTWRGPFLISLVQTLGTIDPATGAGVRDGSTLGSIAAGPHGQLAVVWQDSRFSTGVFDAIAFSRSLDGGLTWSAPVGINAVPGAAAWEPAVSYRSDGTIGVSYYDFRAGGATISSLPTDYWLTQSGDGIVWRETHISGPFDLSIAPVAEGLFLGDYQALASFGEAFVPFFVQTNPGNLANRTDVFINRSVSAISLAAARRAESSGVTILRARAATPFAVPDLAQRVHENVKRIVQRRLMRATP